MKQKHLTPSQYKAFLKHLDAQQLSAWNIALKALVRTGCRSAELLMIDRSSLDPVNRMIVIRPVKGSKSRAIPLSVKMYRQLAELLECTGSLDMALGSGKVVTKLRELRRRWRAEIFAAFGYGYSHISPHGARSSFAVNLYLRGGKDVLLVRELLGHKAISSTMHYVEMSRSMEMAPKLRRVIG